MAKFRYTDDDDDDDPIQVIRSTIKQPQLSVPVSWLIIGLLCAVIGYMVFDTPNPPGPGPNPGPDDQTEVVTDLGELLDGGYIYLVHEGSAPTMTELELLNGVDTWYSKYGMLGKRVYDFQQPAAVKVVTAAANAGITGPFVAIVNDRKVQKVAPWPRDFNELEESLK